MRVEVILDASHRRDTSSAADLLANQGVPTKIDASHAMAHHKGMLSDGDPVRTGRFNFTQAAQEKHAEPVLRLRDRALASPYTQTWHAHAQHRQPFVGRGGRQEWRSGR